MRWILFPCFGIAALLGLDRWAQDPAPRIGERSKTELGAPWVRLTEDEDEHLLHLEIAIRDYTLGEESPKHLSIAGAIHIAEPGFYRALQNYLDGKEMVLFEGVRPAPIEGGEQRATPSDEELAELTRRRMRSLAIGLMRHERDTGTSPTNLDAWVDGLPLGTAAPLRAALKDAWGRPLEFGRASDGEDGETLTLRSLGADGAIGGSGFDADIHLADLPEIVDAELEVPKGLQRDLADALGVVFQLDHMDSSREPWVNADMSIDQIQAKLAESDVNADQLFGMLSGDSAFSRLAGGLLKLLGSWDSGRGMLKIVGVETLARSEEMMEHGQPGEMGEIMKVLIDERNAYVTDALERLMNASPEKDEIAILYGAGHMRDLEARLVERMGWKPVDERWVRALTLDLDDLGMPYGQVQFMRKTIRTQLAMQMKMMERLAERRARKAEEDEAESTGAGDVEGGKDDRR